MSTVKGGAGGPSWCPTPQIGHKLGLCSVTSRGDTWTELTSDNRAHAGDPVSHYSVQSADVLEDKMILMEPSIYLLLKVQQNESASITLFHFSPSGISSLHSFIL